LGKATDVRHQARVMILQRSGQIMNDRSESLPKNGDEFDGANVRHRHYRDSCCSLPIHDFKGIQTHGAPSQISGRLAALLDLHDIRLANNVV